MGGKPEGGLFGSVKVRPASPDDAVAVARLHRDEIPEGFLSSLPPSFLRRLYRRITSSPGSFLLVAEHDGDIAGFIAGSVAVRSLYARFVLRDALLEFMGAPWQILKGLPRSLETLRHGARDAAGGSGAGELLAVAVDPRWRRHRIGSQLLDRFLEELRIRGVDTAEVVVGEDNAAAVIFYERAGFATSSRYELHRGSFSLVMRRDTHRRDLRWATSS